MRSRILLVEDDAPIRQFVTMALEDRAVELVAATTLAEARSRLAQGAFALVLLDLMLPDGSGLDLLRDPVLRATAAQARWVVFSAGLTSAAQEELDMLGVHRVLQKPVSVRTLLACVDEAVRPTTAGEAADEAARARDALSSADEQALAQIDGTPQAEAAALRDYFEGRRELFAQMKARTLAHLVIDMANGDDALARADGTALLRVAHGLKAVLRMLGRPSAAELAQALEVAAQSDRRDAWGPLWGALRRALAQASVDGSAG